MTGCAANSAAGTTGTARNLLAAKLTARSSFAWRLMRTRFRSAGLPAGILAELLTDNAAAVDLSGVALVVRAH
jgi:hypothetical protein